MSNTAAKLTAGALGLMLVMLVACVSSTPSRFYVLSSLTGPGSGTEMAGDERKLTIGVGPLELPAYLDRREIVTRVSTNELHLAGFNEWAEPLKDNFSRVLVENLSVLLSKDLFTIFPFRGPEPIDYKVQVEVIRFDGRLGEDASLLVRWTILGENDQNVFLTRKSSFTEATGGPDYQALVAAQSRTVEALSREIAGAIKGLSRAR